MVAETIEIDEVGPGKEEDSVEVNDFLLETWYNLPESIKSSECFKDYQNEFNKRRGEKGNKK